MEITAKTFTNLKPEKCNRWLLNILNYSIERNWLYQKIVSLDFERSVIENNCMDYKINVLTRTSNAECFKYSNNPFTQNEY